MAVKKKPTKKTAKKKPGPGGTGVKKPGVKGAVKPSSKTAAKTKKPKKKRKPDTLMCFLTTACVRYYNLRDDGYELNTLRRYRDNYLKPNPAGKALVEQYYMVSPKIVRCIEHDSEKSKVYAYIHKLVLKACDQIDQFKYRAAKTTYKKMVEHLLTRYNLAM